MATADRYRFPNSGSTTDFRRTTRMVSIRAALQPDYDYRFADCGPPKEIVVDQAAIAFRDGGIPEGKLRPGG